MAGVPDILNVLRTNTSSDSASRTGYTDVVELRRSITMPMDVSEIQPGKCYVTNSKEKYTVVDINRGIVTF